MAEVEAQVSAVDKENVVPVTTKCYNKTCALMIHISEGTIAIKCSSCGKINCVPCQKVHRTSTCPKLANKSQRQQPDRQMKRKLGDDIESSSTDSDSSFKEDDEVGSAPKKSRMDTVVISYDCRLCNYQTGVKSSFSRHQKTKKHQAALNSKKNK